jgi:hypothetical protein
MPPSIIVVLGIPQPGKQDSDEEYLNVKKRAAECTNLARCFFPFHGGWGWSKFLFKGNRAFYLRDLNG